MSFFYDFPFYSALFPPLFVFILLLFFAFICPRVLLFSPTIPYNEKVRRRMVEKKSPRTSILCRQVLTNGPWVWVCCGENSRGAARHPGTWYRNEENIQRCCYIAFSQSAKISRFPATYRPQVSLACVNHDSILGVFLFLVLVTSISLEREEEERVRVATHIRNTSNRSFTK